MTKRSESFDKYVAEKMQDPEYAKATLLVSIEEFNESVEEALKYSIQRMGVKEFATKANIPIQDISAFIESRMKIETEILDHYLAVFNLKSKMTVIEK